MLKDNYSANMLLSVCLEIFPLVNCLSPNLSNSSCAFTGLHTLFQGLDTMISRMGRYPRSTSENLFRVWCRQLLRKGTFLLFFFWNMSYINHGSLEHLAAILPPRGEKLSENKTMQRLVFRFSVISFDSLGANRAEEISITWISQLCKSMKFPMYLFVCFWLWLFGMVFWCFQPSNSEGIIIYILASKLHRY